MESLQNKIDFAVVISVKDANPNGDPLNGNRPRDNAAGFGEISDVCIKRKIRNRLQDMGESIFLQSVDRADDGMKSLKERAGSDERLRTAEKDKKLYAQIACEKWIDVRSFGQVFAFSNNKKKDSGEPENRVSIGIKGPVTIGITRSVSPVNIINMQITTSAPSEEGAKGLSSTMGTKYLVEFGLYVCKGSINCLLAEKTGFTEEDALKIKAALATLFENDCSSARPEGTMRVCRVYWWKHSSKYPKLSTAKVHASLKITEKPLDRRPLSIDDYDIALEKVDGAELEIIDNM